MIWNEIKKICRRCQFQIVFGILLCVAILDFLVTCKCYYGCELTYVRSAYACTLLHNQVKLFTVQFFTLLLPVVAAMLASDIYYEEYVMGLHTMIHTRQSKKRDILGKLVAVAITVFSVIFFVLLVNLGLTLTAFPLQGAYCSNATYLTLCGVEKGRILGYLEMFHPYLNLVVYILLRSLIAAVFALFAFTFSLCYHKNRYIILLSPLFFYVLWDNIQQLASSQFFRTNLMSINGYGSIYMIVFILFFQSVISGFLLWRGIRRESI